ncbi:MAG: addiction module protein [Tepidisphaeraceae bacterium]
MQSPKPNTPSRTFGPPNSRLDARDRLVLAVPMQKSGQAKRRRPSVEAQLALAERVLKSVHKGIDEQIERACKLEVQQAIALYRAGKAEFQNADDVMAEARRLA